MLCRDVRVRILAAGECLSCGGEQPVVRVDAVGEDLEGGERDAFQHRDREAVSPEGAGEMVSEDHWAEPVDRQQHGHRLRVVAGSQHPCIRLLAEGFARRLQQGVEQGRCRGGVLDEHASEIIDMHRVAAEIVDGGAEQIGLRRRAESALLVQDVVHDVLVAGSAQAALVAEVVHDEGRADAGFPADLAQAHPVEAPAGERVDRSVADAGAGSQILGC